MEGVLEHDDGFPPGRDARDLHGVLEGLGAAVGEHGLLRERARRDAVELLGQGHVALVGRDREAGVRAFS